MGTVISSRFKVLTLKVSEFVLQVSLLHDVLCLLLAALFYCILGCESLPPNLLLGTFTTGGYKHTPVKFYHAKSYM